MTLKRNEPVGVEIFGMVVARSQIVVHWANAGARRLPPCASRGLPAGFEEADIAILDWIVAEGARTALRRRRVLDTAASLH